MLTFIGPSLNYMIAGGFLLVIVVIFLIFLNKKSILEVEDKVDEEDEDEKDDEDKDKDED